MSKNDTLNDSLTTVNCMTRDENFKDIVRYKAIAALLVKFAIPEFKNESISSIARLIVDRRARKENMTKAEILEDEVDFLPTEAGTKDEKNTVSDAVFELRVNDKITEVRLSSDDVTVNTEMQQIVSEGTLGYNLVSRAIYYGASLLRSTVPAGDTNYTGIHKVYSIWFCGGNLKLKEYNGTEGRYVHRYGLRRFYDNLDGFVPAESFADLIEVVLIELKKLKEHDSETERMIYTLFHNPKEVVQLIETAEGIKLVKVEKGVTEMIDYEARTLRRVEEAKKETAIETQRKTAERMIREGKLSFEDILKIEAELMQSV